MADDLSFDDLNDGPALDFEIRRAAAEDDDWRRRLLLHRWKDTRMVTRGRVHDLMAAPAFIAVGGGERIGLATFRIADGGCEITSIDSIMAWRGVGTALVNAVADEARRSGCTRLWLIATNDNLTALRFWQRRDFRLAALYPRAIDAARALKPAIPVRGQSDIPIRDEIELELPL